MTDNKNSHIGITVEQFSIDESHINNDPDVDGLSIIPTRNLVLFPGVTISISLRRPLSEKVAKRAYDTGVPVGIVCQKDPENDSPTLSKGLYRHGVIADILKILELPTGDKTLFVRAREGFHILGAGTRSGHVAGSLSARVSAFLDIMPDESDKKFATLIKNIKKKIGDIAESINEPVSQLLMGVAQTSDPAMFINIALTNFPCSIDQKVKLLGEQSIMKRAMGLLKILVQKEQELSISMDIMRKVRADMDEEQRRAFLQQEMANIQEQLYGDAANDLPDLEQRALDAGLPEAAMNAFNREIGKMRRMNPQHPDYSIHYSYLETLIDIPWVKRSETKTDFTQAAAVLDRDHAGLQKVKDRILEQIAVIMSHPDGRAPILCLVGPPGVGKTSLGRSIADTLQRAYCRVSLGGLHDEAEIRGHRRTYLGAMPGRIIEAMRRAGTVNPVMVLDEVDKIGADYKGDPSAALLEVLDPEQNSKFHDNYVDVDYDLSNVFFIATANTLSTVPRPLIDRMEIIDLSGYIPEEKTEIARRHLLPRLYSEYQIDPEAFTISDEALSAIIDEYTRESGVRQLEKALAKIMRRYVLAKMSNTEFPATVMPEHLYGLLGMARYTRRQYEGNEFAGVVNGLAWTETGGEVLMVESLLTPGKGDKLTLTGNLGDVMKESATIALQWVKAHADSLGIDPAMFESNNVHLHFPEGAIPKDGPSAGITIATSLVSTYKQCRVRPLLAMTGEITLRGKVLPVGGIKEKILAAKRAGITDIIISDENRKDIDDIDARYLTGITFHYVNTVDQVIALAVTDIPA